MYEIVPNLYLSSFRGLDVDHEWIVINCSNDLPMKGYGIRIPINDSPEENDRMYQAFTEVIPWINSHRDRKIVVHCVAGQQRSAAVVAAFLISNDRRNSVDQIIEFIKSKKPDAFLGHQTFRPALERWSSK